MAQSSNGMHPFVKQLLKRSATIVVSWTTVIICLFGTFFALGGWLILAADDGATYAGNATTYTSVYGNGSNQLLSIKVNGTIVGSGDDIGGYWASGYTSGYDVKDQLRAAATDPTIQGVILEINSPGGTIYGSQAIADGIAFYKEVAGQPVYTFVEGQAASGGYWAASGADTIIADYGSDIGSIGVIMGPFQYYNKVLAEDGGILNGGVVTQNGIDSTYITAGTSKDVGSPYRKLTDQELQTLQQSVNNEYDNFVAHVSKHRAIPTETIISQIGALSYDNKTAQSYKLIDHTGSRDAAYDALAKEARIADDYQVVREEYPWGFWDMVLSATNLKPKPQAKSVNLCDLTRTALAYSGDVSRFCKTD